MSLFFETLTKLKQEYQDINPILIIAPTQRCGTTLLQRTINSGGDAVIYGENFFLTESLPLEIGSVIGNYDKTLNITDATEKAFFGGNKALDATALFPDYELYCKQVYRTFYDVLRHYQDYSKGKNIDNWGLKQQPNDIDGFCNFMTFLPNARVIFIYRDLLKVAASMRARWPETIDNEQKLIDFGHRWAENSKRLITHNKLKMHVQYEELIANTQQVVSSVEKHLGIKLDRNEFNNKVNAHLTKTQDIESQAVGKYIVPAEITGREKELLLSKAGEMYKKLGYVI